MKVRKLWAIVLCAALLLTAMLPAMTASAAAPKAVNFFDATNKSYASFGPDSWSSGGCTAGGDAYKIWNYGPYPYVADGNVVVNGGSSFNIRNGWDNWETDISGMEYLVVTLRFTTTEAAEAALASTMSGTIVNCGGVTASQADLVAALNAQAPAVLAGEWVTVAVPFNGVIPAGQKTFSRDFTLGFGALAQLQKIDFVNSEYYLATFTPDLKQAGENVDVVILDADHWALNNITGGSNGGSGIVNGNSAYNGSHWAAINAEKVTLVEDATDGKYFNITANGGWDQAINVRYGADGNQTPACFTGADTLYMTVRITAEQLAAFKSAPVFSKYTLSGTDSYDGNDACIVGLGSKSGVTFTDWFAALNTVTADEWVTLALPISYGSSYTACTAGWIPFRFGKEFGGTLDIKRIVATSEFGLKGSAMAIDTDDGASMRIYSKLDAYTLGMPKNATVLSCGTLLLADRNAYMYGTGSFTAGSSFTYGGVTYPVFNAVDENATATVNGQYAITAEINNIPEDAQYTFYVARSYVTYQVGDDVETIYGDVASRSVREVALRAWDGNQESRGSRVRLAALLGYPNPEYTYQFSGNAWGSQLSIDLPEEIDLSADLGVLKMDISVENVNTLLGAYSNGSPVQVGAGYTNWTYGGNHELGIIFNGCDNSYGVLQWDFYQAIAANQTALAAGDTVTLELPIYWDATDGELSQGCFDGDTATGLTFYWTHGDAAAAIDGLGINITDVSFEKTPHNYMYTIPGSAWHPQLYIDYAATGIQSANYISMDIVCEDIDKLLSGLEWQSDNSPSGGLTYGGDGYKIFFQGTGVGKLGVSYAEFKAKLEAAQSALRDGETVNVKFALTKGEDLTEDSAVSRIAFHIAFNEAAARNLGGTRIDISNIAFSAE